MARRLIRKLADYVVEWIHKVRRLFPTRYQKPFLVITQIHGIFTLEWVHDPWNTFKLVYSPFPRWKYAVPPPLPAQALSDAGSEFYYSLHSRNISVLRNVIIWRMRDSPMRALYRLYDAVCSENEVEIRHESRYIWARPEWHLCDFPDPRGPDPVRYALLAGIMEDLVQAFNLRLSDMLPWDPAKRVTSNWLQNRRPQPLESVPSWTTSVPGVPERLVLWKHPEGYEYFFEGLTSANCKKRNIWAKTGAVKFA